MASVVNLVEAAELYRNLGWTAIPLENDAQGYPKKPFTSNWQTSTPATKHTAAAWANATGLGLVLGPGSGGLCAIDIDDVELASVVFDVCTWTRTIETVRHRAHVYFIEHTSSSSRRLTVSYQGRACCVELKTTGTQVAAPPTPGYTRRSAPSVKPAATPSLAVAWQHLARVLGVGSEDAGATCEAVKVPVWSPFVAEYRNNTLYLEAHRLREAGMSLELALDHLHHRWETRYQAGEMSWEECERTVQSAYRKLTPGRVDGRDTYQLWFGRAAPNADRARPISPDNGSEHTP